MPALPDDSRDSWRPMAREDQLIMTPSAGEMLVYDDQRHVLHHLNPTCHAVWAACDGTRTLAGIGQIAGATLGAEVSEDVVRLALSQLGTATLLVGALPIEPGPPRKSRRVMLQRMAVTSGIALPMLASISAPVAAQFDSTSCNAEGTPCTESIPCCAGTSCIGDLCLVYIPPTPDGSACGQSCSSDGDCFGVCGRCTSFSPVPGVTLFQCQS